MEKCNDIEERIRRIGNAIGDAYVSLEGGDHPDPIVYNLVRELEPDVRRALDIIDFELYMARRQAEEAARSIEATSRGRSVDMPTVVIDDDALAVFPWELDRDDRDC